MADTELGKLMAIEELKSLRARYCRCLDEQDWTGFRSVFTEDADIQIGENGAFTDPDSFIAFVKERTAGAVTVHQCSLPEIEIVDANSARGTWAMMDLVARGQGGAPDGLPGFQGFGHYRETYRRTPHGWRIATLRLTRLRLDPWSPPPPG